GRGIVPGGGGPGRRCLGPRPERDRVVRHDGVRVSRQRLGGEIGVFVEEHRRIHTGDTEPVDSWISSGDRLRRDGLRSTPVQFSPELRAPVLAGEITLTY